MSRRDQQRLDDVQAALDAIDDHMTRGALSDGLVYDAVRVRLIEIGEAVKGLSADLGRCVGACSVGAGDGLVLQVAGHAFGSSRPMPLVLLPPNGVPGSNV
jgi:hypothetical protein